MPRNPIEFRFENYDPKLLVQLIERDHRRDMRQLQCLGVLFVALLLVVITSVSWLIWLLVRA